MGARLSDWEFPEKKKWTYGTGTYRRGCGPNDVSSHKVLVCK